MEESKTIKTVLILARDFPPVGTIGAKRPWAWAKYLSEFGIEPIVVTTAIQEGNDEQKEEPCTIHRVKGKEHFSSPLLRKIHSFIEVVCSYKWPSLSKLSPIQQKAGEVISSRSIDLILASGEPFILFKFARDLSDEFGIPWVADYRDPWSNSPYLKYQSRLWRVINRMIYRPAEKKIVPCSTLVTTPANSYTSKIRAVTNHKNIRVIPNGHDINFEIPKQLNRDRFTIAFSGRLYLFQPIESFLKAFELFIREFESPPNVELVFYGLANWPSHVQRVQDSMGTSGDYIRFENVIPYSQYIQMIGSAHLLLLLSERGIGFLSGKIFDYLALPGKILLYPKGDGELENFMDEPTTGKIADSIEEIRDYLNEQYSLFSAHRFEPKPVDSSKYHRKAYTRELAKLLKQL